MPAIWNVNNVYSTGNKKLSSKLTFEVGEKFSGRVVKALDDKKEVMVKLVDGWQFAAEVDTPIEEMKDGLVRFQVEGFVDGKLKLKLISGDDKGGSTAADPIDDFIKSEGLSPEDKDVVKLMIKFDMHITRENIVRLKSIMNFKDKLQGNPKEADIFIERYLSIKGMDKNSEEGKKAQKLLRDFFVSFNSLNKDELMMMMESGIDLTSDNIESFKKLSQNFSKVFEDISSITTELKSLNLQSPDNGVSKEQITPKAIMQDKIISADNFSTEATPSELASSNVKAKMLNTLYSSGNNKINILQLLKSMTANDNDILRYTLRDVLSNNKSSFVLNGEYETLDNKVAALSDKDIMKIIKEAMVSADNEYGQVTKANVEDAIYKILDRRINISNKDFNKLQDVVRLINESKVENNKFSDSTNKINNNDSSKVLSNSQTNNSAIAVLEKDIVTNNNFVTETNSEQGEKIEVGAKLSSNEVIKNQISGRNVEIKDMLKNILSNLEDATSGSKGSLSKSLDDIVDSVLKEQYKEVDTGASAVKTVIDTDKSNLFEIDSNTDTLKNLLNKDGLDKLLGDKIKNLDENIKAKVLEKINNNIKSQLEGVFSEKLGEKVMELLKNNINDFKVFNSLNNQYYCLDLPLQLREKDYPCKLIIKDNRKDGKKVDSTNVKLVVTVKTFNLGNIDGYLNLKNKILNVDLKCEERFVKPLELGKAKLNNALKDMGFVSNIVVSKKLEEVTLVNCRNFFDDKNISAINVTV
ncbi:hypothetical protein [Clostridium manihotivorum]|uniref:Flagellar hook-length control protein FliK n=1 Tax=Clostridium manihotivorum TaxID=2320868 RepID=A0A3R5QXP4_9CLOT|nr:hypothetical protein [Clostridium manihotivorum]QAA34669.1 hypothetical protein C1I91_25235 [Clostridium manihotivorum]